ncbi:MAG: YgjV family protein [Spirochaetaceae bacterium]|nr:YgjV family protein [Spirochaetaceae bacterium]
MEMILGMTVMEFIGQVFGLIAVIISFVAYQMPTQKKILFMNLLVTIAILLNYAFIGAVTGMMLNVVCVIRNLIFMNREKKIFSYKFYPYLLMVIIGGLSFFTSEGAYSILITIGLIINTFALSLTNPQATRYCMAISCSFIFSYNIFVFSIGGMINEAVAIISSVLGIIRFRRAAKTLKAGKSDSSAITSSSESNSPAVEEN